MCPIPAGQTSAGRVRIARQSAWAFILGEAGLPMGARSTTHGMFGTSLSVDSQKTRVEIDRLLCKPGSHLDADGMTAGIDSGALPD